MDRNFVMAFQIVEMVEFFYGHRYQSQILQLCLEIVQWTQIPHDAGETEMRMHQPDTYARICV